MTIEELKNLIETKQVPSCMLVFLFKKDRFLAEQYIKEISKARGLTIRYTDSVHERGMFDIVDDGNLYVVFCKEFSGEPVDNYIVVCEKTDYKDAVVFPELEKWQVEDYVNTVCDGASKEVISKLAKNKDLYSLESDVEKLCIFDKVVRKSLSEEFFSQNAFSSICSVDAFDFINAVQRRDMKEISGMYWKYERDPMSFVGLMCNQFRNMVNVGLQKNPTEANTGLKSNQIYAIIKVCEKYSKEQIYKIFRFLYSVDEELKTGKLPTDGLFDYLLVKVLSL